MIAFKKIVIVLAVFNLSLNCLADTIQMDCSSETGHKITLIYDNQVNDDSTYTVYTVRYNVTNNSSEDYSAVAESKVESMIPTLQSEIVITVPQFRNGQALKIFTRSQKYKIGDTANIKNFSKCMIKNNSQLRSKVLDDEIL